MKHFDNIRERDEPGGEEDLAPPRPLRDAFAVPALESLLHAVTATLAQTQPRRQLISCQPVILQHRLSRPTALTEECCPELGPLGQRPARTQMAQHEHLPGRD